MFSPLVAPQLSSSLRQPQPLRKVILASICECMRYQNILKTAPVLLRPQSQLKQRCQKDPAQPLFSEP